MEHWNLIQTICIVTLPVIFAITMHQAAMAYAARYLGDKTGEHAGRLSLNPTTYIDPVGTLLLPLLSVVFHVPLLGWPKWVPIEYTNMRNPKRGLGLVAAAGTSANLLMALAWASAFKIAKGFGGDGLAEPMAYMAIKGVQINVVLMVVNLIPLPPLDGGRILLAILPPRAAGILLRVAPWGTAIMIVLLMSGALGLIIQPFVSAILFLFDQIL